MLNSISSMKAKLIKNHYGFEYFLKDANGVTIATSDSGKLSIKNCQAIERGYDFDEYAEAIGYASEFGHPSPEGFSDEQIGRLHGFIDGFQKALELMETEIKQLREFARDCAENWDCDEDSHRYNTPCRCCEAKTLKQQTEWDVEIETIAHGLGNDKNGRPVSENRFLLDVDGCLILKRV